MLGNEVLGRGTYFPLKSNKIKYFYDLIKEDWREKSLKIMIKYLKIMIRYKSKENMDYRRLFSRYCDSNLTPWDSLYILQSNFLSKPLFCLLLFSKFLPRCMLQIIHHVFEFIIAQHLYVIIGYFWFLILSYWIYRWPCN